MPRNNVRNLMSQDSSQTILVLADWQDSSIDKYLPSAGHPVSNPASIHLNEKKGKPTQAKQTH
jgi:hypothetical protein